MKTTFSGAISKLYLFLIVFTTILCVCAGYLVIRKENTYFVSQQRANTVKDTNHIASQIETKFFGMEVVADRLARYVSSTKDISRTAVARAADRLVALNTDVVSVAVAPDLVVTRIAPLKGNEKVIGTKYWQVPTQLASIARAYRTQSPVIDGPVNLIQGGRGYILRYPVFVARPGAAGDRFWGVISIVLSENGLFISNDEGTAYTQDNTFAIRELNRDGSPGRSIYGDNSLFEQDPAIETLKVFGATWQLAGVPQNGWATAAPNQTMLVTMTLASIFVIIGAIFSIRHFAQRRQEAYNVLSHAVEALDESFVLFDADDNLLMANSKYKNAFGASKEVVKPGTSCELLYRVAALQGIFPDAVGRESAWLKEQMEAHRNAESQMLQVEGGRWVNISKAKTPEGFTAAVWSDISAQKEAQLAAEAANRQKSEFLSNVTHELRTPLTVISGHAAFLANDSKLPNSKKIAKLLDAEGPAPDLGELRRNVSAHSALITTHGEKILSASQHMLTMVNDLLDWAKAEGGNLSVAPVVVDPSELVGNMLDEMKQMAQAKGIALDCKCDGEKVIADPSRLRQVIYNLVGNALKFTNEGSITVIITGQGERTLFAVEDTGCGIAPENMEMIFERFQQVDGSATRAFGGFGLGLSIARQIVLLHGGTLRATSELGKGSRFEFDLETAPADEDTGTLTERSRLTAVQ